MNTIIEFKRVDILQKTNMIFQDINFKISAGEFIYIIGILYYDINGFKGGKYFEGYALCNWTG